MQELIIKMAICLLIALALGFLFGWLLKRAFANEKYGSIVETLESDLTKSKDALKISEEELALIKEQFINVQDELETSSLKATELEDRLGDYSAKLSMYKSNVEEREARIQEEQKQKNLLKTQLDEKHHEFEKVLKESANQNEVIHRIKEHHGLLQGELTKLKEAKDSKDKELEKLSIMIENHKANELKLLDEKKALEGKLEEYKSTLNEKNMAAIELGHKVKEIDKLHIEIANHKDNEIKLLDEKKAKEGKLVELESILNEKKIAAIELESKVKEMDTLKQKNSALIERLRQTETNLKEAKEKTEVYKNSTASSIDEGFFNKLEETVKEQTTEKFDVLTKREKPKEEGFGWMKLAKKALHYVEDTSEKITKNADEVIKEYKKR